VGGRRTRVDEGFGDRPDQLLGYFAPTGFQGGSCCTGPRRGCWVGGNGWLRRFDGGKVQKEHPLPRIRKPPSVRCSKTTKAICGWRRMELASSAPTPAVRLIGWIGPPGCPAISFDVAAGSEANIWAGLEGKAWRVFVGPPLRVMGEMKAFLESRALRLRGQRRRHVVGSNGNGVKRIQDGRVRHYGEGEGLTNPLSGRCTAIARETLAGTWGGGLFRLEMTGSSMSVRRLVPPRWCWRFMRTGRDRCGSANVSIPNGESMSSRARCADPVNTRAFSRIDVRSIAETADGTIWLGTTEELLRGRMAPFPSATPAAACRKADQRHGSRPGRRPMDRRVGHGLVVWENGRFTPLPDTKPLLDDNLIRSPTMALGTCGAAPDGVIRIRKADLRRWAQKAEPPVKWQRFSQSDGLPGNECSGAGCRARDGRIWFATAAESPRSIRERFRRGCRCRLPWWSMCCCRANQCPWSRRRAATPRPWPFSSLRPGQSPPAGGLLEIGYTALNFTAPSRSSSVTGLPVCGFGSRRRNRACGAL